MEELKCSAPVKNHCCEAMQYCDTISISKRHIGSQNRWMWEQTQKNGHISANEITFCPYCGIELNHHTEAEKPLTLEQLRRMDGEPVWVGEKDRRSHIGHYGLVDTVRERIIFSRETYSTFRAVAGKTVYARKPEGSESS